MHMLNLGEDQWTHHGFLAYEEAASSQWDT